MSFEFEKEVPKVFVEGQMRNVFNLLEDMKVELRGYNEAELQEVKEIVAPWMAASNRTAAASATATLGAAGKGEGACNAYSDPAFEDHCSPIDG